MAPRISRIAVRPPRQTTQHSPMSSETSSLNQDGPQKEVDMQSSLSKVSESAIRANHRILVGVDYGTTYTGTYMSNL